MKTAVACLLVALALGRASAMAQAASDPMDRLRACSTLSKAERMECLDVLSRTIGQESWVVSETTSPIDYSPVVVATATASGAPGGPGMKLSIACRGGKTSLVVGVSGALPAGDVYTVSYAIDNGSPKVLAAVAASSGTGMALVGDVLGFLASLPDQGEIAFHMSGRQGVSLEGRFALAGLKITRERMAISCKWPPK
jgi:hypothetical protein